MNLPTKKPDLQAIHQYNQDIQDALELRKSMHVESQEWKLQTDIIQCMQRVMVYLNQKLLPKGK